MIRQVIGELDADAPLSCHDSHFKWRRARRKTVSEYRQPVPFGEVGEHCRIAACGEDPSRRGIRPEPPLFKILLPHHATHSILSIKDHACSTVEIEHGRRGSQLLELTSGFLAARAVAGAGQNRQTDCLDLHLAALAHRGKVFVLLLLHCAHSWVHFGGLFCRSYEMSATGQTFGSKPRQCPLGAQCRSGARPDDVENLLHDGHAGGCAMATPYLPRSNRRDSITATTGR